jgi:hypothetical protein
MIRDSLKLVNVKHRRIELASVGLVVFSLSKCSHLPPRLAPAHTCSCLSSAFPLQPILSLVYVQTGGRIFSMPCCVSLWVGYVSASQVIHEAVVVLSGITLGLEIGIVSFVVLLFAE